MIANAIIVRAEGPAVVIFNEHNSHFCGVILIMVKLTVASVLLLCASLVSAEDQPARETKLIALVKSTPVSLLDRALPAVRFNQWLRTEAGPDGRYQWEVNDCGEQTGAPGQNPEEIPTCVEADAWLKDGREIVIMIGVEEPRKGNAAGEKETLVFSFGLLVTARERIDLKHLSDLPAALIRTHEPASYPEIAK
jgi:hypothetical protein